MSRFNTKTQGTKISNLAGGEAYAQSPELELLSILLTSFANDQFYRSSGDTLTRLKELIGVSDKKFVAQAAVYARTEFGMRSISHVAASELARYISGQEWAKDFFKAVIYRPDDITEILSYHTVNNGKIPNAMKKGLAAAFDKFDAYKLAKYRGEGKGFKLIDAVNMVHPTPIAQNKEALEALVKGELRSFDTWESELSKAGQNAETDEQKDEFKKDVWTKLIGERKIGYFALLRNLRNIIEQAPEALEKALEMLIDEKLIKSSLVLPFRFSTAYEQIEGIVGGKNPRAVLKALNRAVDISIANVPRFDGDTLVVLDESGSMSGRPAQIGSLFAAVLVKSNDADFITFSDNARYRHVNSDDSTLTIQKSISFASGGTNFHSIFQVAKQKYDRIIILSDMQAWMGGNTPTKTFNEWKNKFDANPFVYSFDLAGNGSMQFPEQNVFAIAGFSDKIFTIMGLMEKNKKALLEEIKKVIL